MKFLSFILLISNICFCQTKMTGIGDLKIDSTTTAFVKKMADAEDIKVDTTFNSMDIYKASLSGARRIYKIEKAVLDDPKEFISSTDPHFVDLNEVSLYYINNHSISSIYIEELYLYFLKDTLYKIQLELSKEVTDAMTIKYGQPQVTSRESIITCRTKLGIEYKEKEAVYFLRWKTSNPKLECLGVSKFGFNDKCEKEHFSDLSIESKAKVQKIQAMIAKQEKEYEKKKLEEKKKKLSDF